MFLGITAARVGQLMKDGWIPEQDGHNKYDLAATAQGYIRYLQSINKNGGTDDDSRDAEKLADIQIKQNKAKMSQMELEEREGTLVKVDVVAREWDRVCSRAKTRLMAVASKVASKWLPTWDQIAVKQVIESHVREALEEMAAMAEEKDEEPEEPDVPAEDS